jgi:hypothetical protein
MDAHRITFRLKDRSRGFEINPERVPVAVLADFSRDVEDFLKGDDKGVDTAQLAVSVVHGSLALVSEPVFHKALFDDLLTLLQSPLIDGLQARRREVVARVQKWVKSKRDIEFSIESAFLPKPVVIDAATDFRTDDADQWVSVERYVRGEIEDLGGTTKSNAHIRLPDGKRLTVEADRNLIRDDKHNRLYKPAMVRIRAEFNVLTSDYRKAQLLEFVEYDSQPDHAALRRLREKAEKAWADVPDASAWVDQIRGGV